ncbi:hypothetical protein EV424DRAFT_1343218 [Suillus variegatus]|nr:hypothetical protein EV424DRAFT_1343218 [Suillus variegatus]
MSTNWSIAFKPILDLHSKAIFAAGSSSVGKPVVRKIQRAILTARDEQEEPIALPTSLKKAIKEYYAKSLKDKEEADECEAYCTGNAREWFNNMTPSQQQEVKFAMKKWNEEGCQKKLRQYIVHQSRHKTTPQNAKKKFSVSSSGIKEWAANGFESFGEWSKTEFYPSEDSDHAASDCEDGPVLPEIIVDDEGYAKLPLRDGIGLKGQHELIRSIFHTSYKVCTGGSRSVPWNVITASPSNYLEPGSVPTGFVVKNPSHMKIEEVNRLWMHWEQCSATNQKPVVFIKAKDADIRDHWEVQDESKHITQPATHETTPDDVAINDRYTFLETLSKNENHLELVDTTRDLAILAKQKTCPISEPSSAMPVVLGIGLLYRQSKHVIEYEEDEADPNTPFYLPHSAIDLQFLVALDEAVQEVLFSVIGQIKRLNKEGLSDENEEMRMVVEKERHEVGEKDVESEENVVRGEEQQEQEVEKVVQKGRKRKINHASSNLGSAW